MCVCGYTINENRKRGASKAAETRKRKRSYPCGVCKALYGKTDEIEFWIACDGCNTWFHGECVNIKKKNEPEHFLKYYFCKGVHLITFFCLFNVMWLLYNCVLCVNGYTCAHHLGQPAWVRRWYWINAPYNIMVQMLNA